VVARFFLETCRRLTCVLAQAAFAPKQRAVPVRLNLQQRCLDLSLFRSVLQIGVAGDGLSIAGVRMVSYLKAP